MDEPRAQVEVDSRIFVLDRELTRSLVATGVVHVCMECDTAGRTYHLDVDHTVQELRAAGAREWSPPSDPRTLPHRRLPSLLVHHLA